MSPNFLTQFDSYGQLVHLLSHLHSFTERVKSQGLLEVMVLISGDQRKRNVPGAALRRARDKLVATSRRFILNSSDGSRDASQRRSPVIIGDR